MPKDKRRPEMIMPVRKYDYINVPEEGVVYIVNQNPGVVEFVMEDLRRKGYDPIKELGEDGKLNIYYCKKN